MTAIRDQGQTRPSPEPILSALAIVATGLLLILPAERSPGVASATEGTIPLVLTDMLLWLGYVVVAVGLVRLMVVVAARRRGRHRSDPETDD